jgi:hypothetical protein
VCLTFDICIRGSKPKPSKFLKPLNFRCLASVTAISRASRTMCNRRAPVRLARHRPILVILAGNIPEKRSFRECCLLRHQAGSHPVSIGDRSAIHRFRESLVTTGEPLEHSNTQRRDQEVLTEISI